MTIQMNILQSMMAINAQAIHECQEYIADMKLVRKGAPKQSDYVLDVSGCNEYIRKAKHRMSLLERNQRAMAQEVQELIFQGHMDKLTNVEYDDLVYH